MFFCRRNAGDEHGCVGPVLGRFTYNRTKIGTVHIRLWHVYMTRNNIYNLDKFQQGNANKKAAYDKQV